MGIFVSWITANWFTCLQTAGIVGGLGFTGYTTWVNSRVRRVETLVNLTAHHRALWLKFVGSPELKSILRESRNLEKHPVTNEEMIFINLIILHLDTSLSAARSKIFPEFAGQDDDIKWFFSLPTPKAVWESTKEFRDPRIVAHVESVLNPAKFR